MLCTCDTSAETSTQQEGYFWALRTLDKRESARGICNSPSKNIGEGLEHQWVELNLNCENCFDFDYQPADGDNLVIHQDSQYSQGAYLSFIYKNNNWEEGFYDEIGNISKLKCRGKVKSS